MVKDPGFRVKASFLVLSQVVGCEKHKPYGKPECGFEPVFSLKRLKQRNAKKQEEDGKVCTQFHTLRVRKRVRGFYDSHHIPRKTGKEKENQTTAVVSAARMSPASILLNTIPWSGTTMYQ